MLIAKYCGCGPVKDVAVAHPNLLNRHNLNLQRDKGFNKYK